MIELTKQQKHELYSFALLDIESDENIFCCASFQKKLIDELIKNKMSIYNFLINCKYIFNELYEQKTRVVNEYDSTGPWFNTKNERIAALKKCIEMTK